MIKFTAERLEEISRQAEGKKIIVLGDLMVDEYLWGDVSRISPEAPVPIINISEEQIRFGGAANVAYNLMGLNAVPILVGVVGKDRMGHIFRQMLEENNLPQDGIVELSDRPTTVKTRIIGNNQHIARVDKESTAPLNREAVNKIIRIVEKYLDEIAAIIIQDYNKGVVIPPLIEQVIPLARQANKFVTVDPKFENFLRFKNVTVFKPNTKETEAALATPIRSEEDVIAAGKKLLQELGGEAVLITRGSMGMALFEKNGDISFIGTRARKVADVSGAGDTVIATLTYGLCGGASIKEAVTLSNYAAGLVCEEVGVVPVQRDKLLSSILKNQKVFSGR